MKRAHCLVSRQYPRRKKAEIIKTMMIGSTMSVLQPVCLHLGAIETIPVMSLGFFCVPRYRCICWCFWSHNQLLVQGIHHGKTKNGQLELRTPGTSTPASSSPNRILYNCLGFLLCRPLRLLLLLHSNFLLPQ